MNYLTRRDVIAGASGLLVAGTLARTAFGAEPRVRPDVESAEGKRMLKKYAQAVALMKGDTQIRESDARSWTYQWYIHAVPLLLDQVTLTKAGELNRVFGSASSPAKDVANKVWVTCQAHGGSPNIDPDMFLPWHRMYLLAFEAVVRSVLNDDDFNLPYWDYTTEKRRSIPAEFRMKDDPLYRSLYKSNRKKTLAIDINAGDPMDKGATISPYNLRTLQIADYQGSAGFCARLDTTLHGNVHVGVGNERNMGWVPTAAGDPIFWLHHCTIDRMWAGWNELGGKNPAMSRKFPFAGPDGKLVEMDAADMGDTKKLGYQYESLPKPPQGQGPITISTSGGGTPKVVATSKVADTPLGVAPTRIPLVAAAPGGPISSAVEGTTGQQKLYVVVSGLKCAAQPGTLYEAFLDLPANADAKTKELHYLGTFNFFKAEEGERPAEFQFEATEVMRKLNAQRKLGAETAVTIIPLDAPVENARPIVGTIRVVQQ